MAATTPATTTNTKTKWTPTGNRVPMRDRDTTSATTWSCTEQPQTPPRIQQPTKPRRKSYSHRIQPTRETPILRPTPHQPTPQKPHAQHDQHGNTRMVGRYTHTPTSRRFFSAIVPASPGKRSSSSPPLPLVLALAEAFSCSSGSTIGAKPSRALSSACFLRWASFLCISRSRALAFSTGSGWLDWTETMGGLRLVGHD